MTNLRNSPTKRVAKSASKLSCLQNLINVFGLHYEFYGRQPVLSRMMLREMTFYDSGRQAGRFQQTRERNIRIVGRIVADAIEKGSLQYQRAALTSLDGFYSASSKLSCGAG